MGLSAMPSSNAGAGQRERLPTQSGSGLNFAAHFFVGSSAPVAQSSSFPVDCVAWRGQAQAPGGEDGMHLPINSCHVVTVTM
jgi:hypothetical protein